ncbi:hypothetical protein [Chitinimonas sp. BJYL2]|uniref:hypothetical protein n=1 Tax=Chitinimonas sp. BJYL2 TaxID=2976696 RepID=UPI0022B47090|nr:hypothetical protein [Chitinimonas sp. BJYL2]
MSHHTPIDDPDLQRAYAALDQPAPSAALDAAILAAAHAAVQPQAEVIPFTPRPRRNWLAPLSLAASLTLAVGVGWHMQQAGEGQVAGMAAEIHGTADTPPQVGMAAEAGRASTADAAPASAPAPVVVARLPAEPAPPSFVPQVSLNTPVEAKGDVRKEAKREATAGASGLAADQIVESAALREQVAVAAAPPKAAYPERTIAPAPAPIAAAPPAPVTAPVAAEVARKATVDKLMVSGARARQPMDFDRQIAQLRQWLAEGKTGEAEAGLKALRQQWPDKPLPEDIRRWAGTLEDLRQGE